LSKTKDLDTVLKENNLSLTKNGLLEFNNLDEKNLNKLVKIYQKNGYTDLNIEHLRSRIKIGNALAPRVVADEFIRKVLKYTPNYDTTQIYEDAEGNILTKEQVDKVNLERLDNVLKEQAFLDIKGKKAYREKAFLVEIEADKLSNVDTNEKVLLQGVIDLLVVGENEAEIFDYKYSKHDGVYLKTTYKKQLDLYAYAVEKILRKPVVSKKIVNLLTGEIVPIS
jgi:ATP-dependent exoDNAse (exonuclease V) beta subunit